MKVTEAKTKVCPLMSDNTMGKDISGTYTGVSYCVCSDCIAWAEEDTKIKATYKMPYDIYPYEEGRKHKELIEDGFIETGRGCYVQYASEDEKEGYCKMIGKA